MKATMKRWDGIVPLIPALGLGFGTCAGAHDLKATVPISGGGTVEVPVDHWHVCTEWTVPIPPQTAPGLGLDPETEEIVAIVVHRKEFSDDQRANWAAFGDAWTRTLRPNVVRRSPPTNARNCHGVTFDSGGSWINNPKPFLERCSEVAAADAQAGDVVVYRDNKGNITHTGRILRKDPDGTIWVHSQLGQMGDFDHKIDDLPQKDERVTYEHPPGTPRRSAVVGYGTPKIYRCPP